MKGKNVLAVSPFDVGGGAEAVARMLLGGLRQVGCDTRWAVGETRSQDPSVREMSANRWQHYWKNRSKEAAASHTPILPRVFWEVAHWGAPLLRLSHVLGREPMDFPASWSLAESWEDGWKPDLMHLHNLHGHYFDLRALPSLSHKMPVVITMHDAWLLSGHCAHSFGCERWQTGCGHCPDLTIPPSIVRDGSAANWRLKREVYRRSRLHVATPSKWLMERVEKSILMEGIVEKRVIPHGVDLEIYQPNIDRNLLRQNLGLAPDDFVIAAGALGLKKSRWKDYQLLESAIQELAKQPHNRKIVFLTFGSSNYKSTYHIGSTVWQFDYPYLIDPKEVAQIYQAADILVHPAKVDTFPNVVMEAMACGCPVIGTAVGGIPEQVTDGIDGLLVVEGNIQTLHDAIMTLLKNPDQVKSMGRAARLRAELDFDHKRTVESYAQWFAEIHDRKKQFAISTAMVS